MEQKSPLRPYAKGVLVIAAVLLIPALLSLFSALFSAATTGQVMVISVGRTETTREMVHWSLGWSRFASPFVIFGALVIWGLSKPHGLAWWLSSCIALLGVGMLVCSYWFASLRGTIAFFLFSSFVCTALYIGNRFGLLAAIAFVL